MGGARTDRRPRPRLGLEPWPGRPGRFLCHPDAATAQRYARAVAAVAPDIERSLGVEVVAGRVIGIRPLRLEPWTVARERFGRRAVRMTAGTRVRLHLDVQHCFDDIRVEAVRRALQRMRCAPEDVDRVAGTLMEFAEVGVMGLPVGPAPSTVLANAVLTTIDDAMRVAGVPFLRWIDDVVAFPGSAERLTAAIEGAAAALRASGLRAHPGKTAIVGPGTAPGFVRWGSGPFAWAGPGTPSSIQGEWRGEVPAGAAR